MQFVPAHLAGAAQDLAPDRESASDSQLSVRRAETSLGIERPVLRMDQELRPIVHVEHDCIPGPDRSIARALEDEPDICGVQADPRVEATAASVAVTPWYAQSIKHCSISTTSIRSTFVAEIAAMV